CECRRRLSRLAPVDSADPAVPVDGVPGDRPRDALLPGDPRLPARFALQLLVADAKCDDIARPGPESLGSTDDLALWPIALFLADAEDQRCPVGHRDVLALAVDIQ